jgi:hypothetical protein
LAKGEEGLEEVLDGADDPGLGDRKLNQSIRSTGSRGWVGVKILKIIAF